MADYYVCSDNIDGKENSRINALCDALKKKGHTATNGGVGPNTIQSHGQTGGAKGQIGVFICGGVDIQVFWDFVQGIGSYYHYKRFIYVYASETATTDKWLTCNGAKNTPTVQAHDDNYSGGRGDAIGKTVHQYCTEHKDKIWYACGPLGCSFNDVIQNFLKGEGAGNENNEESNSASSIKQALKEVLSGWDGDVECYIREDTVFVHKIPDPTTAQIVLAEGRDVFYDGVKVTDVNPTTINDLTVIWNSTKFHFRDEELIKRFGEVKSEITIENEDVTNSSEAKAVANTEWAKIKRDNGHSLECKAIGGAQWQEGQWVRVYLPSFDIDDYMYLVKVSQNDDHDWISNLKFTDYPPSLGEPREETETEEDTEEEDTETSEEAAV